jgi:hypothetical protein
LPRALAALATAFLAAGAALAENVPGTSNPYLAGLPSGATCCSGDVVPAQSPVQVVSVAVTPGTTITFSATGGVDFQGLPPSTGPDGGFVFTTPSSDGISGATWPVDALVGVFLDASDPTSSAAPADLDFGPTGIGTAFTTLSPALKQAFFIGDGLTGTGSGTVQTFVVPAGATRLFLGTSDGFGWANNSGAFTVTPAIGGGGGGPPVLVAAPIPTLSEAMLALAIAALATFAVAALRRR